MDSVWTALSRLQFLRIWMRAQFACNSGRMLSTVVTAACPHPRPWTALATSTFYNTRHNCGRQPIIATAQARRRNVVQLCIHFKLRVSDSPQWLCVFLRVCAKVGCRNHKRQRVPTSMRLTFRPLSGSRSGSVGLMIYCNLIRLKSSLNNTSMLISSLSLQ